jgi:secreted PhoX family phosphatase
MNLSRRALLGGGLGSLGLVFSGARSEAGALNSSPDAVLDLPDGFTCEVLQRAGDLMSDGYVVPGRPDGMACFAGPSGSLILMRNHELRRNRGAAAFPADKPPAQAFDPKAPGGVTRLVLSADGKVLRSNLVLAGTMGNCGGGPSPWGWMSCEEHPVGDHGYVFLCDPAAEVVQPPRKIAGYGRMNHEAVAVDPVSKVAWLTEDRGDGCLYRFVPRDPVDPFSGRLEAMCVEGYPDTTPLDAVGIPLSVRWVAVEDRGDDTLRQAAVAAGASTFSRGEGCWFANQAVTFAATSGGPFGRGQIWRLDPAREELTLLAVGGPTDVHMPDNLTVSPQGWVVMAEDNGERNHIRGLRADGTVVDLARNARSRSEFCGVCFSPDGQTLFANIQVEGLTVAIRGPFASLLG